MSEKEQYQSSWIDRQSAEEAVSEGGLHPKGHLILVLPDQIAETSLGGIALPTDTIERDYLAQIFATVVEIGPNAWFDEPVPRAAKGDRVMIAKYQGQLFKGADGKRYRLMNDKDILATVDKEGVKA